MNLLDLPNDVFYVISQWMTKYMVTMCMFTCKRLQQAFFADLVIEQFVPQKFRRRYPLHSIQKMFLIFNDELNLKERLRLRIKRGHLLNRYDITKKGASLRVLPRSIGYCYDLRVLNLSDNRFTKIPEELGLLTNLTELILEKNQITRIPLTICQCKNITLLNFNCNQLTEISISIGLLTNLKELSLIDNQITHLPQSIDRCSNLIVLKLSSNPIRELPNTFHLSPLTYLDLDRTNFKANLSTLKFPPGLLILSLSHNAFDEFPQGILKARCLQSLNLSFNNISVIPYEIWILNHIWQLKLENNKLSQFPLAICHLTRLSELWLHDNKMNDIPKEILNLRQLLIFNLINSSSGSNKKTFNIHPEVLENPQWRNFLKPYIKEPSWYSPKNLVQWFSPGRFFNVIDVTSIMPEIRGIMIIIDLLPYGWVRDLFEEVFATIRWITRM